MLALFMPRIVPSAREVLIAGQLGLKAIDMEETREARDQLIELRARALHEIDQMQKVPEHTAQVCLFDRFDGELFHDRYHPEAVMSFEAELMALGYDVQTEAGATYLFFSLPKS